MLVKVYKILTLDDEIFIATNNLPKYLKLNCDSFETITTESVVELH